MGIPSGSIVGYIVEVELKAFDILLQIRNVVVGFVDIEFQNPAHLYLPEPDYVFSLHLSEKVGFERLQSRVDM